MTLLDDTQTRPGSRMTPPARRKRRSLRRLIPVSAAGCAMMLLMLATTHDPNRGVADEVQRSGKAVAAKKETARAAAPGPSLTDCLSNPYLIPIHGAQTEEYRDVIPTQGTTYDARTATFDAYPFRTLYPFAVGKESAPSRLCVLGGLVRGSQSRSLTWNEMKVRHDGDALRVAGNNWYLIDGLRADNVEDGVAPRGTDGVFPKDGDGFVMRNLYFTYIRDDCVENDDIAGGLIYDSLFDGCYTGISERPTEGNEQWRHPAPEAEILTLDRVLLRLQAMPGPYGSSNRSKLGHGQLFKWSDIGNKVVIRNSIFLVERKPNSTSFFPFPPGTVTENVTIVWLGSGRFSWDVPAGTTVTRNRAVWDEARRAWLSRHGCTSFEECSKLTAPDPA